MVIPFPPLMVIGSDDFPLVWHGLMRRYQELPTMGGRFVSEFGMEAYPHLSTIKSAITDPKQQHPGSMVMDYHNRAIDHERRLLTYVAENFNLKYDLPSFTHLTQMTQADVMDYAYRSWRRDWGSLARERPVVYWCGSSMTAGLRCLGLSPITILSRSQRFMP